MNIKLNLVSLFIGVLYLCATTSFGDAGSEVKSGSAAPVAEAYLDWTFSILSQIETNMPTISAVAQVAADAFVAGRDLGVRGGAGLNEELGARSGGLCVYRATKGNPGDVVLYAFGVATEKEPDAMALLDRELSDAEALKAAGSTVIGLASFRQLEVLGKMERAKKACSYLMDNGAPAGDGLFSGSDGKPTVPTFVTADAIVSWVWMAEFYAACTRAGKTPAMYQSVLNDPDRVRYNKHLKVRFHDDMTVAPIPAGQLGRAYIPAIRGMLDTVRRDHWQALADAARRAARTIRDGSQVHVFARGHYPPRHVGGQLAADRSGFRRMQKGGAAVPGDPGKDDFAIAVGYSLPPGDEWWGGADQRLRQAGRGVCWIISGHRTRPEHLRVNELLLDQVWPDGDAALAIPGYDVGICPPSGVMAEAVLWMLTGEAWAQAGGLIP